MKAASNDIYEKPKVVVGDGEVQTAREHTGTFGGSRKHSGP